jgi:hypothetical protein
MSELRPLRTGLFIYEWIRLFLVFGVLTMLRSEAGMRPALLFAAPNALFTIMAVFLLSDFSRYGVYAPLYAAGKCVSCVSLLAYLVITRLWGHQEPGFSVSDLAALFGLFIVFLGDLLSIGGGFLLIKKLAAKAADKGGE